MSVRQCVGVHKITLSATKSPFYLHAGKELLDALNRNVKTQCGYATLHSVKTRQLEDRMESFFLAETVKYLYVSFSCLDHVLLVRCK